MLWLAPEGESVYQRGSGCAQAVSCASVDFSSGFWFLARVGGVAVDEVVEERAPPAAFYLEG